MSTKKQGIAAKTTIWVVVLFYLLIAFEIFYMAGPFAVYFYGVYNPILNFFNQSPIFSVLNSFFLPHVARETSSGLINAHNYIGTILALLGFAVFLIGACQIYYAKFSRKGAVTGGFYNFARHPQYTSFAVCGFGLLILWPRYINLLLFITMLFVYYLLAKAEERECEEKFGQSYIDYKNKTAMFFPVQLSWIKKTSSLPAAKGGNKRCHQSKGEKMLVLVGTYIAVLAIGLSIAKGVNALTINSLYANYTQDSATISLCEISAGKLDEILDIAFSDEHVKMRIDEAGIGAKLLNYILPTQWYAAEVPMNGVEYRAGHRSPSDYDNTLYKVIFTKAELRGDGDIAGKEILTNVLKREPIIEVWIDLTEQKVVQILEIPATYQYQGIPVAIF